MDKEKIQIWASIAEVVSAVAVVITLVYVVYEVRQSQSLQSSEVDVILYQREATAKQTMMENPGLVELVIRARADPGSLTPVEHMQYAAHDAYFYDTWELAWNYYNTGVLGVVSWTDWNVFFTLDAQPRSLSFWRELRSGYSPAFQDHVNKVMEID